VISHLQPQIGWDGIPSFQLHYIATHNVNRWNNTGLPISRHDSVGELSECRDSIFFSPKLLEGSDGNVKTTTAAITPPSIHDWMPKLATIAKIRTCDSISIISRWKVVNTGCLTSIIAFAIWWTRIFTIDTASSHQACWAHQFEVDALLRPWLDHL